MFHSKLDMSCDEVARRSKPNMMNRKILEQLQTMTDVMRA